MNPNRRRPRLEPKEQFEARLKTESEKFRNPERHHEALVAGLQTIVDAHQRRREAQARRRAVKATNTEGTDQCQE
jgi:hypothetical protein